MLLVQLLINRGYWRRGLILPTDWLKGCIILGDIILSSAATEAICFVDIEFKEKVQTFYASKLFLTKLSLSRTSAV